MQQQQHLCRYLLHVFVVRECFLRLAFASFSLGHNSFPFSSQGNVSHKLQSKKRKNLSVLFFHPFHFLPFPLCLSVLLLLPFLRERSTKMVKPSFVTLFKGRRKEGKKKKAATYEIRKGKEEAEKKKTRISFLSFSFF